MIRRWAYESTVGPLRLGLVVGAACAGVGFVLLVAGAVVDRALGVPLVVAAAGIVLASWLVGLKMLARVAANCVELRAVMSLNSALGSTSVDQATFFTDGAAATPSLQLLLYKTLRLCRPASVLELGSGQTTKLLAAYYHEDPSRVVVTLEENRSWAELIRPQITRGTECHEYRFAGLERRTFRCAGSNRQVRGSWYRGTEDLASRKFDLVLVDGPSSPRGSKSAAGYARAGFLQYVPGMLTQSFVVIVDDCDRYGEHSTVLLLEEMLRSLGIPFFRFDVHGTKTQSVVCSPDRAFLAYV